MSKSIPLALDIDGTLIHNDLTHELFLKGVCLYPLKIFTFLYLALTSKPKMKALLISLVGDQFDASVLPYNKTVINMAQQAKADGREVVLCSGSQESLITQIGDHFDWVDHSFGTTETLNLTKENKAAFLKDRYPQGFDYFGNSTQDYAVWKEARRGFAIEPPKAAYSIKSQDGSFVKIVEPRKSELGPTFKALRLHQWAKNLLIFLVPLLVINKLTVDIIPALILGFISMGLIASATYVFNDLVDIDSDRQHHSKNARPFANGSLSIPTGVVAMIACGTIGFGIAFFLPGQFIHTLFLYFTITLSYSAFLKRQPIIDVLVLAFLFLVRVLAGDEIVDTVLSPWLVSFVLTFFLSLSLAKRYTELAKFELAGKDKSAGRGYLTSDKYLILGFGMMATAMTMISFVLYGVIADKPVLSQLSSVLVIGSVLIYWLMRMWLLAHRGKLNDDPVLFAIKDKMSILLGFVILATVVIEQVKLT